MSNAIIHPLEQTLIRVRQLSPYLKPQLGIPSGTEWRTVADLAPGSAQLETLITATEAYLNTRAPAIVASAILQNYQWPLITTAMAYFLIDRRVPDISAANTLTGYDNERKASRLALLSSRFATLPTDLAANHPDATVLPDTTALRSALRSHIEAHLGMLINHLCIRLGCKPRGLWLNVADCCAGTLVWLMQAHNPSITLSQIEAEITALLRERSSPLNSRQIGLIQLRYGGHCRIVHDRATCCYWYKTDGGDYCATCPHRTSADRRQQLLAHIVHDAQAQATVEEVLV
ncbi:(2Fe-2S)-binding protein [Chloroflexus islandicus]|uniref:(2Fe-2S)-binding protein n=1 Tax=Chloroflexus islandicus TaxID=1707952 RepID=UPI000AB9FDA1|nr:(2Fe-2S)-binding protein [Chloroflexus islandicus]